MPLNTNLLSVKISFKKVKITLILILDYSYITYRKVLKYNLALDEESKRNLVLTSFIKLGLSAGFVRFSYRTH